MTTRLAALLAAVTIALVTAALLLAPTPDRAHADPAVSVGVLDPACVVPVVVFGTVICLVGVTSSPTPPTSTTTTVPPVTS